MLISDIHGDGNSYKFVIMLTSDDIYKYTLLLNICVDTISDQTW